MELAVILKCSATSLAATYHERIQMMIVLGISSKVSCHLQLEISTVSAETRLGSDLSEVYAASDLRRHAQLPAIKMSSPETYILGEWCLLNQVSMDPQSCLSASPPVKLTRYATLSSCFAHLCL